jgi:hypothetical protein
MSRLVYTALTFPHARGWFAPVQPKDRFLAEAMTFAALRLIQARPD